MNHKHHHFLPTNAQLKEDIENEEQEEEEQEEEE
jgi:FKBP-type peptidyl-prolyl cis-trans isomerase